jgi:type I restriction enzyme S subunit
MTVPLKRVARIVAGQSPPSADVSDLDGMELPFIQGNAEFGPLHPTPRLQCDVAPKRAEWGDVLLSVRAPVGALNVADQRLGIGRGLCAIRPGPSLDMRFAWWVIVASAPSLAAVATGSTYDAVSADDVGSLHIPFPPLTTQRAIADYLDGETARIDALIHAKQRMATLLRKRFMSALDNALWETSVPRIALRRISRFVDYRGATPTKEDHGVPLVTASHVRDGLIDMSVAPQFIGQESYVQWMRRGLPAIGDAVMTTEAPMGEVAQINDPNVALAQRLILFKSFPEIVLPDFLALALRSLRFQAQLEANATGSTALGIKADRLKALCVPVPTLDQQAKLVAHIRLLDQVRAQACTALSRQVALLNEHRQALITAAVNGQLDIPESA